MCYYLETQLQGDVLTQNKLLNKGYYIEGLLFRKLTPLGLANAVNSGHMNVYRKHLLSKEFLKFSNTIKGYYFKTRYDLVLNYTVHTNEWKNNNWTILSKFCHSAQ